MRSVDSPTNNPFWEKVRKLPGNSFSAEYYRTWEPEWYWVEEGQMHHRRELCKEYSWAIPDPASLLFLKEHIGPRVVEMGAGVGYWAWQLSQLGIAMLCYDAHPPDVSPNGYHSTVFEEDDGERTGALRAVFYPVQKGTPEVLRQHGDRTLFLCWPPYSNDMAIESLRAYPGPRLVYIGEDEGGCTADEAFFTELAHNWREVATHQGVQWWGLHDRIYVYEREP
jgi:hypothetical protein